MDNKVVLEVFRCLLSEGLISEEEYIRLLSMLNK